MSAVRMLQLRIVAVLAAVAGFLGIGIVPSAMGQPAGFPDLNAFTEVPDGVSFARPDRWANGYAFFRTPDGISCAIGSTKWCSGKLPGLPASEQGACTFVVQKNDEASQSQPFRIEQSDRPCEPPTDTLLNPGQKLTFAAYGTTCVVGEGLLTACIDTWNHHGFVLQPSGSWTF